MTASIPGHMQCTIETCRRKWIGTADEKCPFCRLECIDCTCCGRTLNKCVCTARCAQEPLPRNCAGLPLPVGASPISPVKTIDHGMVHQLLSPGKKLEQILAMKPADRIREKFKDPMKSHLVGILVGFAHVLESRRGWVDIITLEQALKELRETISTEKGESEAALLYAMKTLHPIGCFTLPNGECIGLDCIHTAPAPRAP